MSKQGLKVAIEYGEKLREFQTLTHAEQYYVNYKNEMLDHLKTISQESDMFTADFTIDSLKKLEKWYFYLYEINEFSKRGFERTKFEKMMSIYFGEVVIQNNKDAKWVVEEYPFTDRRYTFGVNKGLGTIVLGNIFKNHYEKPNNKRRNSIYRKYNHYFK